MTRPTDFAGTIGRTLADSEPHHPAPTHPGDGAPNIVVILLDDTGFAQLGCYGSDIDTPHLDALAAGGIRFTDFHVTPLCSPTRASLLTGRSQHAVGMRSVSNFQTGFPNQLGHITPRAATVAEVLRDAGWSTFCAGKWHLAPMEETSAAGPFDQWPLGRGFDRFYGFLEGETDQFHPELVADNHHVDPPAGPEDGYHLSEDLVDRLLAMIADSRAVRPDRPFLAYLPFGATHAPHQAPPAYLAKYRGRYDEGWDVVRERWFARQKELGVIPDHTVLADRNPGVQAWADLSDDERALAARLQEAFAAFLDHTDDQIGRLVAGLERLGVYEDTIVVALADNGASQEGGPLGVLHEMKWFNGILEDPAEAVGRLDDIGGPTSHTNYPWGWAQCGNTPFRWYKQNTHEGGVHVPMIWHWPRGLADQAGTLRHQFVNVADIVPTLYELVGIEPPTTYRGVDQLPVTGHSFAGVLSDPDAPAANTRQYFEMAGSRALVDGRWKAVCRHRPGADFDTEPWELYDLAADPSETNDLADAEPDRLAALIGYWWEEAERHGVLPLDDRTIGLFGARFRPGSPHPPDRRYVYRPAADGLALAPIPSQAGAAVGGRSFTVTARLEHTVGDEGVLWATGSENSGITVFVQDDRVVVDYNSFADHTIVESVDRLPSGAIEVTATFTRTGEGGTAAVAVGDAEPATGEIRRFMRMISSLGASVGHDHGSPVSERYRAPFPYAGRIHELVVQVAASRRRDADEATARSEMARQ